MQPEPEGTYWKLVLQADTQQDACICLSDVSYDISSKHQMPALVGTAGEANVFTTVNPQSAFLFDLDGTLVDSVYHHVLAWHEALTSEGIELSIWRIHRKVGMSGGLFTNMLLREIGVALDPERIERLQRLHAQAYKQRIDDIQPLPGAAALLTFLTHADIPWAVATSGRLETAGLALAKLGIEFGDAPIITRDDVRFAKPDPDLFLAAAARLGIEIASAFVVGDSVWDMLAAQRARALGIGVLSGGYGLDELERAGAYRVFEDPADLLRHIDELGARSGVARQP